MDSRIFSISGLLNDESTTLKVQLNPPIYLDPTKGYVIGLVSFETYNAIPNVHTSNNIFKYGDKTIEFPVGSYEMRDIAVYLEKKMDDSNGEYIEVIQNNNTLRTELKCTRDVDLTVKNSIAPLMGFKPAILKKKTFGIYLNIL